MYLPLRWCRDDFEGDISDHHINENFILNGEEIVGNVEEEEIMGSSFVDYEKIVQCPKKERMKSGKEFGKTI